MKKIKLGSLKETGLSLLPDLTGFLTPTTITDPQMAIANVGVAIITKKISDFVQEYKQKKKSKKIKDEVNISTGSSFYEILKFIDEKNPDEETLKAIKSIFFRSIRKDSTEQEESLAYQFMQICKQLTGQDILILKASYEIASKKSNAIPAEHIKTDNPEIWASSVAMQLGHQISELITSREEHLVKLTLILPTHIKKIKNLVWMPDPDPEEKYHELKVFIANERFRLTKLGYRLCEYLSCED
ncbi:hypothetical protein K8Q98_03135 [Candidatus Nomurabacteria bacterium]|nr:hypothetical protein [Candidatus Nomurabacteria bacterium]